MDGTYPVFLFLHLLGLALGGAPAFGHLVTAGLGPQDDATAKTINAVNRGLGLAGKIGFLLLIISGPVMLWMHWSLAALNWAFWIKMGLVLALIVNIGMATSAGAKAERGDRAAAARLAIHARLGAGLMIGLVLFAVVAFG
jgi:hypothetical protein